MERFNTCTLRNKEVINLCDGARLGSPTDFEIDVCDGKIISLIIEGQGGFLGFGSADDIVIPWCKIECIGEDAILVKVSQNDIYCSNGIRRKRKKNAW